MLNLLYAIHIPEEVRFILCAPSFGAAGLAARPLPTDKGFTFVVGAGAAMAAHGSSSSTVALDFTFKGFDAVFGAGAAMEPHKSSSSSLIAFAVFFGRRLVAINDKIVNIYHQFIYCSTIRGLQKIKIYSKNGSSK